MNHNTLKQKRRKVAILSLLCIACAYLTPMHAQESCYEQYLREHNKKILTVEDADDSYDELKKSVLAKQMCGDPYYTLMADTIAQRVMLTKVDGTYIADVHVSLVDSTWYMWLSVDPLADKNISTSPYLYCNGNPIMFIDPDGRDGYQNGAGNYVWFDDVSGKPVFYDENGTSWSYVTNNKEAWTEATTIREAAIQALCITSRLTYDEVKMDVSLFSESSELFTKLVKLSNSEKYVSEWSSSLNSSGWKFDSKNSNTLGMTVYKLKYYPQKNGEQSALGFVLAKGIPHVLEAAL